MREKTPAYERTGPRTSPTGGAGRSPLGDPHWAAALQAGHWRELVPQGM